MAYPNPLYITNDEGELLTAAGVVSESQADITYYDGDTYRNEVSAAKMGRAWTSGLVFAAPETGDDVVVGTAPRFKAKKVTWQRWLDGAGSVLAACPVHLNPRTSGARIELIT